MKWLLPVLGLTAGLALAACADDSYGPYGYGPGPGYYDNGYSDRGYYRDRDDYYRDRGDYNRDGDDYDPDR